MIIHTCHTCSPKTCHTYFAKIHISELELVKDEASRTSPVRSVELALQTVLELVSYAILELDTHQQLQLLTHQASTTTPTSRCCHPGSRSCWHSLLIVSFAKNCCLCLI